MLSQISVSNFALIENAKLPLNNGFTVITGETGSGKSILLGALKLILGERADYSVIRDESKKTVVEAIFKIATKDFSDFFKKNDLDIEEDTIIRREINANGKSRAFINDTPVQLNLLKELTEQLIHIHSQHHTLELRQTAFQRNILDVIGENETILNELSVLFNSSRSLSKEIHELEDNRAKIALEFEFNSFQLEELSKLQLNQLNYEEIEKEVERAEQFEEIKENYQLIVNAIGDDNGVLDALNRILNFKKVKDQVLEELSERINSVQIELKDIVAIAEDEVSEMTYNPEDLSLNIIRLDAFNSALRKHNFTSQEELKDLVEKLQQEVDSSGNIEEKIEQKQKELNKVLEKANKVAKDLSARRIKVAKTIEKQVSELLSHLKLDGATIRFDVAEAALQEHGADNITLYFAPNKGMVPQPIERAASGGELSRLMLAIQFLLSQKQQLPTVIFDEIDTGVSGEVAQKIGAHLKSMGEHMQLIAITHLPQVASKGMNHILVKKSDVKGRTETSFQILDTEERIEEIAKLMSGSTVNEAALLNAKNLMNE